MEHTQTEIRQPHSMPVTISVPNYPRLAEMKTKLQSLKGAVNDYQSRLATLTRETITLNQRAASADPDQQVFERLAAIKGEINQTERELAGAQYQASRVEDEHGQWLHEFAWRFYRRQMLSRELAEASADPPQMRAYALGEKPQRPRIEVLTELSECLGWLAVWSGDPKLAEEARTINAKLAEARQESR